MKDKKVEFSFDKFVKDIEKRENQIREKIENHQSNQESHPGRKYNKLYRERWQNRIRFRRK
jgi:IS4 transposase